MPLAVTIVTTPSGKQIMRGFATGTITEAEATEYTNLGRPGGKYQGYRQMTVSGSGISMSAGARKAFAAEPPAGQKVFPPAAVVLNNPVLRVTVNFILKVQSESKHYVRVFGTEDEALKWLDTVPDWHKP